MIHNSHLEAEEIEKPETEKKLKENNDTREKHKELTSIVHSVRIKHLLDIVINLLSSWGKDASQAQISVNMIYNICCKGKIWQCTKLLTSI